MISIFKKELELIQNEELRKAIEGYMTEKVPKYFWSVGASSSGKYHPKFAQGEGGLVRHTKAVVKIAEELLRLNTYAYMPGIYKDYVIAACIIHDTMKYGETDEENTKEYKNHAENAARAFSDWCIEVRGITPSELLLNAVKSHMGQWGEVRPFTSIDRCVHMADYIASRSFIDIDTER